LKNPLSKIIGATGFVDGGEAASSPYHGLHAGAKLAAALVFIVLVVSVPVGKAGASPLDSVTGLFPFLIYPVFVTALSGARVLNLLKRIAFVLPFTLAAGAFRLYADRRAVFVLLGVQVTDGLVYYMAIIIKAALCVWAALLLSDATPIHELTRRLSAFGLPKIMCQTIEFSYRYAGTLASEASTIKTAYTIRRRGKNAVGLRHSGTLLGLWLIRSGERASRVYQAMVCRGYDGVATGAALKKMRPSDALFLAVSAAVLVLIRVLP